MDRHVVEAANSTCPATFGVACNEQAGDRQQGLRRYVVEGDTEACVIASPRGRTQQPGMECGDQPYDVPTSSEGATGGELNLDLNDGSRRDALRGRHAQATETDICTATQRCERFSIEGREVQPRLELDAFSAALGFSMLSGRTGHLRVLWGLLNLSARGLPCLECKSKVTSRGSTQPALGFPPRFGLEIGSSRGEIRSMNEPLRSITESTG